VGHRKWGWTGVVVGVNGGHCQLVTCVALTGVTATPGSSVSMLIRQIAALEIVSADQGDVLLWHSL
jgi:hypothetical protein